MRNCTYWSRYSWLYFFTNCCNLCFYTHFCVNNVRRRTSA